MTFSDSIPQDAGFYHVIDRNDFGTDKEGTIYVCAFSPRSPYTNLVEPLDNYINTKHRSIRDLLWGRMLFLPRYNPTVDVITMHPQTPDEHKFLGLPGHVEVDKDTQ